MPYREKRSTVEAIDPISLAGLLHDETSELENAIASRVVGCTVSQLFVGAAILRCYSNLVCLELQECWSDVWIEVRQKAFGNAEEKSLGPCFRKVDHINRAAVEADGANILSDMLSEFGLSFDRVGEDTFLEDPLPRFRCVLGHRYPCAKSFVVHGVAGVALGAAWHRDQV